MGVFSSNIAQIKRLPALLLGLVLLIGSAAPFVLLAGSLPSSIGFGLSAAAPIFSDDLSEDANKELDAEEVFQTANEHYAARAYQQAAEGFALADSLFAIQSNTNFELYSRVMHAWAQYYLKAPQETVRLLASFEEEWSQDLPGSDSLFYHFSRCKIKLCAAQDDQPCVVEYAKEALRQLPEVSADADGKWSAQFLRTRERRAILYGSLGRAYFNLGQYVDAGHSFTQSKDGFLKGSRRYINQLNNLAAVSRRIGQDAEALKWHQEILQMRLANSAGKIDRHVAVSHYNIGRVEYDLGNYKNAIQSAQLFLAHFPRERYNNQLNDSRAFMLQANAYLQMGKADLSEQKFRAAIDQLVPGDYSSALPDVTAAVLSSEIIFAIDGLAESLAQQGSDSLSIFTTRRCLQMIDELRRNYRSEISRYFFSLEVRDLYERTLARLEGLRAKASLSDEDALVLFWEILEKSKSLLLLESKNEKASLLLMDSASLDQSTELRQQIANLDRQIAATGLDKTSLDVDSLEALRFKLKRKQEALTAKRSENENSASWVLSLSEFQSSLETNQSAISWFVGKENLYSLLVTQEGCRFFVKEADGHYLEEVNRFREALQDEGFLRNDFNNSLLQCQESGGAIYDWAIREQLLALDEVKKSAGVEMNPQHRLLLLPDAYLHGVPFEALFINEAAKYLQTGYSISYAWSGVLAKRESDRANNFLTSRPILEKGVAIVAPDYTGESDSGGRVLPPLAGAAAEARMLQQYRNNFLDQPKKADALQVLEEGYPFYHFAMHAYFDTLDPLSSALIFPGPELLEAWEIGLLNLQAELVVLSACETGAGRIQISEGVEGLSREFLRAGVKAVLSSQWPADDRASLEVMTDFYRYYGSGIHADQALQAAKFAYLENATTEKQHPYYWAGMLLIGESDLTTPFISERYVQGKRVEHFATLLGYFIMLGMLFLGVWYYFRRRSHQAS